MAVKPLPDDDLGCIILITPVCTSRSRRLIVPHDVAEWLYAELGTALPELKAETEASRRRGRKRGKREVPPVLSGTF